MTDCRSAAKGQRGLPPANRCSHCGDNLQACPTGAIISGAGAYRACGALLQFYLVTVAPRGQYLVYDANRARETILHWFFMDS